MLPKFGPENLVEVEFLFINMETRWELHALGENEDVPLGMLS